MTYQEAKNTKATLESEVSVCETTLKSLTQGHKNSMGLTPDHIKALPEYKSAKLAFDQAFKNLQNFNSYFIKTFKKEINQERKTR